MTTDFRALCAELLLFSEEAGEICYNESLWPLCDRDCTLQDRARDALAEPLPEPPTLPEPVPIGERLPGPEDLNEDGQCWWLGDGKSWMLLYKYNNARRLGLTHWLPANAIPTPTVK